MEIKVCGLQYLMPLNHILMHYPLDEEEVVIARMYGCLQSACFSRGPNVRLVRRKTCYHMHRLLQRLML